MRHLNLVLILLVLEFVNTINAQWERANGPYGGVVNCVAGNDKVLLASFNGGLYRSTDKGTDWDLMDIGGIERRDYVRSVNNICFADSNIFIGASDYLWKSTDNGNTWFIPQDKFLSGGAFTSRINHDILVYYSNPEYQHGAPAKIEGMPGILYFINVNMTAPSSVINNDFIEDSLIIVGTNYGIYISPDAGRSWRQSNQNLTDTNIVSVFIYKGEMFAGSVSQGIFCSTDSGKTWSASNSGLTFQSIRTFFANDNIIYAGTNGGGVFESDDFGQSWHAINTGLTNMVINTMCSEGEDLIAGTNGSGVYKYSGGAWSAINNGLRTTYINNFASIGNNLYTGTRGCGVYMSTDNGMNWNASNEGLTDLNVNALITKGTNLYAGTMLDGIFQSSNNGISWNAVNNGVFNKHISSMTTGRNNIYAGTQAWSKYQINTSTGYTPWQDSGMVYMSTDNGSNWCVIDTGLFSVITMAGQDNNIFISSQEGGLKFSSDEGASWKSVNIRKTSGNYTFDFNAAEFTLKDEKLFASGSSTGIYSFNNQDTNWEALSDSGLINFMGKLLPINSCYITAMTSNDTTLFAAFMDGLHGTFSGLYISSDDGNSWKEVASPFENNPVPGLTLQPYINTLAVYNNYLYAGTNYFGVWRVPLSDIVTGVKNKTNETPSKFTLEQNYPNPFNPATTIKYELPEAGFVTLKVYDILGREVQTLVNDYKNMGTYEVNFNGTNLASGVYLYKLKAGNFTSIKKMIIIK